MVKLSPPIVPTMYVRQSGKEIGRITIMEYADWDLVNLDNQHCSVLSDDMVRVEGIVGDYYIGDGHAHVNSACYDTQRLAFIKENLLRELSILDDNGVVSIGEPTTKKEVTGIRGQ